MNSSKRYKKSELINFTYNILKKVGLNNSNSKIISNLIIRADERGVWSHGNPCISLPLLQGENNLPLGIQVIGEKYDDNRFLGVCSWLEKESEKFNE